MNFEQALNERKFRYSKKDYEREMKHGDFRDKEMFHNPELKKVYCKYCGNKLRKDNPKCQKCGKDTSWEPWRKKSA